MVGMVVSSGVYIRNIVTSSVNTGDFLNLAVTFAVTKRNGRVTRMGRDGLIVEPGALHKATKLTKGEWGRNWLMVDGREGGVLERWSDGSEKVGNGRKLRVGGRCAFG
jgi:hypothetical protein